MEEIENLKERLHEILSCDDLLINEDGLIQIDLIKKKQEALKKYVSAVLDKAKEILTDSEFNKEKRILELCEYSPSGDGYGTEHYFLNFRVTEEDQYDNDGVDIVDVARDLDNLYMAEQIQK